jgi:cytochrome c biogenesis protein CcmG/thiol:disulfide interchange protein DsbE
VKRDALSGLHSISTRRFLGAALMIALAALGCSPPSPSVDASQKQGGASPLVGQPAPEIHAEKVSGDGPTTIAAAKGKVTILDFWATYCHPCKKSFPRYQELVRSHAKDVAVIAMSVDGTDDSTAAQIAAFGKSAEVTFAIVWDKDTTAVKAYHPPKMPSAYIIDRKGIIRSLHAGYEDGEETRIAAEVERLIAEP